MGIMISCFKTAPEPEDLAPHSAPNDSALKNSALENSVSDNSVPDDSATDDSEPDDPVPDNSVPDRSVPDDSKLDEPTEECNSQVKKTIVELRAAAEQLDPGAEKVKHLSRHQSQHRVAIFCWVAADYLEAMQKNSNKVRNETFSQVNYTDRRVGEDAIFLTVQLQGNWFQSPDHLSPDGSFKLKNDEPLQVANKLRKLCKKHKLDACDDVEIHRSGCKESIQVLFKFHSEQREEILVY